jgi:hypothetical protein
VAVPVDFYLAQVAENSVFAQDVEEIFLSSVAVVLVVVSTLHESTSQHRFPEYFSVVYYPNSTSTWKRMVMYICVLIVVEYDR